MRLFYLIIIFAYRIDNRILKYYIAINNRAIQPKENQKGNHHDTGNVPHHLAQPTRLRE